MKDIINMVWTWLYMGLLLVVTIPLGWIVVPIALMFSKVDANTLANFTTYHTSRYWVLETLPDWAWWYSNDRDGARGDKRGWWDMTIDDGSTFWNRFRWLALRNPVHNLVTFSPELSCNVNEAEEFELLAGQEFEDYKHEDCSFQWIRCESNGKKYYHLYVNKEIKNGMGIYIRIGHKFKLEHVWGEEESGKEWKKFTLRFRPWTEI